MRELPTRPRRWPSLVRFSVGLFAMASLAAAQIRADISPEARLKAAFVYRFVQFVEWPSPALQNRPAIDVCVLDPNPFEDVLQTLFDGEVIGGRRLAVRVVPAPESASACHVLFLPQNAPRRAATLRQVARLPVLTVSDAPGFLESGGIIQLGLSGNHMRFTVNLEAARNAGVRLSSQLLRLAASVRGGGP